MNKFYIISIIISLSLILNCEGLPTKLYNPSKPEVEFEKVDFSSPRAIFAEACGFQLLLVIPINTNDRHFRAFNTLQNLAGREYITDIEITESWTYGLVGTLYCTIFKANSYPYKTEK